MSLNKKRIQLVENGVAQDVDILTSAECVSFEDGENLQDKYDNGDIASIKVLGDLSGLDNDVVSTLNELGTSARETAELIGDMGSGTSIAMALKKEVSDGKWTGGNTLPYQFIHSDAIVLDGEIHIMGTDYDFNTTYYNQHYKYNGSTWNWVSTLPYGFYNGCAVVYNNEIHIMGGNHGYTNHYKYNGSTWESVSTLPYNFNHSSAVVLDGEIHILGTGYSNSYYRYHYKYNGTAWESVSTLPYGFSNGSAIVLDGEIHILGGRFSTTYYKYHYKFNGTNWSSVSTLPYEFDDGSTVLYNGQMHILGGTKSSTSHYKWNRENWVSVGTLPYTSYSGRAVVLDKKIHLLGDGNGTSYAKYHYSIKLGTYLNGYTKKDTQLYLPISTTPLSSNLQATTDGYIVTEDGYTEILINE